MERVGQGVIARRPWLSSTGFATYGFTALPASGSEDDIPIAARLITAYNRARAGHPPMARTNDAWTEIVTKYHKEMIELIERRDAAALAAYLRELPRRPAGHGFLQGLASYNRLRSSRRARRLHALWILDQLVGMAEALGVLLVRCPEQGGWNRAPEALSANQLRTSIEARIGLPIALPPVFDGLFVIEPVTGAIHLRTLVATYAVHYVARLMVQMSQIEASALRVAEIGAGFGYGAFVAAKLGVARYAIYDLPEVNVAQGYFLLKSLSSEEVALYGEVNRDARVSVLPGFCIDSESPRAFDVTINIDSMPEISLHEAERYLSQIARCSTWFFSVNQETQAKQTQNATQSVVHHLVSAHRFDPLFRYPNWIRAGYVDELWRAPRT